MAQTILHKAETRGDATLFDDQGNLSDDSTREHLKKFLNAFVELVAKNTPR